MGQTITAARIHPLHGGGGLLPVARELLKEQGTPFAEKFLGFYINSSTFHDKLLPHIQGIKVCSISKKAIKSLTIYVPIDIEEQRAIAAILTDMDAEISGLEQRRAKYEQIKQGMMQQLLTGRIRLN